MIGGRDHSGESQQPEKPIDYEEAVREILRRRRKQRIRRLFERAPDPRPSSPGQVVLVGLILLIVGWLFPPLHLAMIVGTIVLVFGFLCGFIQPRGRTTVWRNRTIVIPPSRRWTDRIYYLFFRRPKDL